MSTITLSGGTSRARSERSANGWLSGISASFRDYLARSRAENQLQQLDDRLLLDIGIKRADISDVVWGR